MSAAFYASTSGVAHASHDLNGVTVLEIHGWRGPREIMPRDDGGKWVTITAPIRHGSEFWTFQAPRDGVLNCHSDLIGSPSLLTEGDGEMQVLIPPGRMADLVIRFDG